MKRLPFLILLIITTYTFSQENHSIPWKQTIPGMDTTYNKAVMKYLNMPEYNWAMMIGIWIPTGDLKILGNHIQIGFQSGIKHRKMNYDISIAVNANDAKNNFHARRTNTSDTMELTRQFFGAYLGMEIGRDLFAKNGHEIQLTGGIGAEMLDVLQVNNDKGLKPHYIWSYNFNIGLGYRYYFPNSLYLGMKAKYNITDYSMSKVIDFTGNTITIQFTIGGLNNVFRNSELKKLSYPLRG